MKEICNGKIDYAGRCEKCYQVSQTTSCYCTRLIDVMPEDAFKPPMDIKDQIIQKQDEYKAQMAKAEYIGNYSLVEYCKGQINALDFVFSLLKSRLKEQQCHAIIEKVREANTPDKRSFEEAEARLEEPEEDKQATEILEKLAKILSKNHNLKESSINSCDVCWSYFYMASILDKENFGYLDFARKSLRDELIKFLNWYFNWRDLEFEDGHAEYLTDNYLSDKGSDRDTDHAITGN